MTLREIEESVAKLPPDALASFRKWFAKFDGERWDDEIADDAEQGRLDTLASSAIADHTAGKSRQL